LSAVDIALITIILLGAYKGYKEGFVLELFSLLGIVLGVFAGFKLMGVALIYLSELIDVDKDVLPYVAFALIFIAIVIIVTLVGKSLKASIDKSFLGRVDEGAGAALGLIKTAFLMSVALWLIDSIGWNFPENWTRNSEIMPLIASFAPKVGTLIAQYIPMFHDIF
jgi:membrane protein required for colicin V production